MHIDAIFDVGIGGLCLVLFNCLPLYSMQYASYISYAMMFSKGTLPAMCKNRRHTVARWDNAFMDLCHLLFSTCIFLNGREGQDVLLDVH